MMGSGGDLGLSTQLGDSGNKEEGRSLYCVRVNRTMGKV